MKFKVKKFDKDDVLNFLVIFVMFWKLDFVISLENVIWRINMMIEIVDEDDFFIGFFFFNFIWMDLVIDIFYFGFIEIWEFINFILDVYFMYIYLIKFKVFNI